MNPIHPSVVRKSPETSIDEEAHHFHIILPDVPSTLLSKSKRTDHTPEGEEDLAVLLTWIHIFYQVTDIHF